MAVTTNQISDGKDKGNLTAFPVASGETIYKGTIVVIGSDGLLYNLDSAAAPSARVIGIVADDSANVSGPAATTAAGSISGSREEASADAGDKTVRQVWLDGQFKLTFTSIAQSDVGKIMYATDNYTVDETASGGVALGTLVTYLSATSGWVDINN